MGKLFGVLIIFNPKFSLALGMVRISWGFRKLGVSLGCLYDFHTRLCSQMTSGGNLCHIGTSKFICEANQWTGFCVMWFLPRGCFEQTMILNLCGSVKYTSLAS